MKDFHLNFVGSYKIISKLDPHLKEMLDKKIKLDTFVRHSDTSRTVVQKKSYNRLRRVKLLPTLSI